MLAGSPNSFRLEGKVSSVVVRIWTAARIWLRLLRHSTLSAAWRTSRRISPPTRTTRANDGTYLLHEHRLPRYQWTFLESRTRVRLLAFRRELSTRHGMAFLSLAGSWLRLCGVPTERTIQPDWAGVRRGVGLPLTISLVWRLSICVRWEHAWGARSIMVVWSAVIGRMRGVLPAVCVIVGHGGGAFERGFGLDGERVHSGYGMAGRTPYACCVALGFHGSWYAGVMSVVLLDNSVRLVASGRSCCQRCVGAFTAPP